MIAPPARRRVRGVVVAVAVVVLVGVVALLGLPLVIREAVPRLLERETGLAASVERVTATPWNGRFVLHGLRLGAGEGAALFLERVRARVDMGALLRGHARVLRLELGAGEVNLEAASRTTWRGPDTGHGPQDSVAGGAPLALPDVTLDDVTWRWLSARLGTPTVLRRLTLERIDADVPDRARLALELAVGDGKVTVHGVLDADRAAPAFSGRIAVQAVDASTVAALLPAAGSRLEGRLGLDGQLDVTVNPGDGEVRGVFDGRLAVADGAYAAPGGHELAGSLDYRGTLDVSWPLLGAPASRLRGVLSAPLLRLSAGGGRAKIADLRFAGEAQTGATGALAIDGTLGGSVVTLATTGAHGLEVHAQGLSAELAMTGAAASAASPAGLSLRSLRADAVVVAPVSEAFAPVRAADVSAAGVSFTAARGVAVTRAGASAISGGAAVGRAWRAADVGADALTVDRTGAATSAAATAGHVEVGEGDAAIRLESVKVERLARARTGSLRVGTAAVRALDVPLSGVALRVADAVATGLSRTADGAIAAESLVLGAAGHEPSAGIAWSLAELESGRISVGADRAVAVAGLSAASVGVTFPGAGFAFSDLQLSELAVQPDGTLSAAQVASAKLAASLGDGLQLAALALTMDGASWGAASGLSGAALHCDGVEIRRGEAAARIESPRVESPRLHAAGSAPHGAIRVAFKSAKAWQKGAAEIRTGSAQATDLGITADGAVNVQGLRVQGLGLGPEGAPLLAAGNLRLEGVKENDGMTRITGLAVGDPVVRLERAADGMPPLVLPFHDALAVRDGGARHRVRIGRLATTGAGRLHFIDREPEPDFEVVVTPLSLEVVNLDSHPGGDRATFKAEGRVGDFTSVVVQGTAAPAPGGLDVAFSSRVTGFDVVRLGPYLAARRSVEMRGGRADVKLDGSVKAGRVDAQSEVVLSRLELVPRTPRAGAAALPASAPGTGMALSTALMLLRDDKDTVRLKVPVAGPLADPAFDLYDAVRQAVAKAATGAAMEVFKPAGLLLTAARVDGGPARVGFEPVLFAPAVTELPAAGIGRLDALAGSLKARGALKVMLCGRAVPADGPATDRATLAALAEARAGRVREYLRERHKVADGQLLACASDVDPGGDAAPRVELVIDAAALGVVASADDTEPARADPRR